MTRSGTSGRPAGARWRFAPVYLRNLLVWRKLALPSIVGNIADPLIMLVAFGYGLGRWLQQVDGVPYIVFLAGGTVCMSAAMAASFEALYSAFSRMHVQRTWESILNAPVELDDILVGEWLWAASKSLLSGSVIVAVVFILGISREPTLILVLPVVALAGLAFSAIGLCFNALARGYDFFTYYFTLVITPMTFLAGVYYPTSQFPDWLGAISAVLPLTAAVELARPLVLGRLPEDGLLQLAILAGYSALAFQIARVLTRRRFAK
ncbi:MAG: ABC transporter permease [Burkholderiaceae bacterium]|nr:ABC transporter permease [Burkholderiaceae bacterium]